MSDIPFAIHLGGGLYMDSWGNLHQGAPPETPIYEAPFKLPVDPKKIKDVLKDVKDTVNDIKKDPDVIAKIEELGLERLLPILAGIAKIAGVVAPVFAVLGFAVDVAKFFGLLKDGPNALEQLMIARFEELKAQVQAIADLIQTKDLRNGRIAVENFSSAIRDYVNTLKNTNPTLAQLENDRNNLLAQHGVQINGISTLIDPQTWMTPFDRDSHQSVWAGIAHVMHTHPFDVNAPPTPIAFPPDSQPHFDHRLMVPLSSWAAETWLACIRGIDPEYRSTGSFKTQLEGFARKLDGLAQGMRQHVLGRTFYKPEHFSWPVVVPSYFIVWEKVEVDGIFQTTTETPKISPGCSLWPVGALDLRYHDDLFFAGFFKTFWKAEYLGYPHPTKHGGMDMRWIPPATLEPDPFGNFKITNPAECAAAANAQSEKDYVDLLTVSGYPELLQLATLLRHESTAPDRSQTVTAHKPMLFREPQPKTSVQVKSEPILMAGVITSDATREPQKCQSTVEIWTQPIKRARPMEYQVRLRTLRSIRDEKYWREPAYKEFRWAQYDPDPANPSFLKLSVHQSNSDLDDKLLIPGWNSSPRDRAIHAEGNIGMTAHTFDWWIPVKFPWSIATEFKYTAAMLRAANWQGGMITPKVPVPVGALEHVSPPLGPMKTMGNDDYGTGVLSKAVLDGLIPEDFIMQSGQDWEGEHREVKQEQIKIRYQVDWEADRLYVRLWNDLEDRNYVVYVVVEEKLPVSGQILHTAVPVPMNGLLTYVPQQFFDDERAAWERGWGTVKYFNDKYIEEGIVGPADPVVKGWRPGDFASRESIERFFRLAGEHQPELLREAMMRAGQDPPPAAP